MEATIKIKMVRSPICTPDKQRRVLKGLGLRKLNQVVVRPDTAVFRGMVNKVPHLLEVID
jgi:large subunit ribosomal protein L30